MAAPTPPASGDMVVQVNGTPHTLPTGTSIGQLLDTLGLRRDGVAVAVQAQVVPRTEHAQHVLAHGDRVEVLRAVGGG